VGEVGKVRVGKERHVAHELMDAVWLGRVERDRVVADVLRRVEHAERQAVEEIARREQPGQVERIGVLKIFESSLGKWKG
jgi:hypothetical protein